jgi:uncharacterized protein
MSSSHVGGGITVLSIRIDNGTLLATRVRVISDFWQSHWPFDRPHLSAEQGLLLNPCGGVHTFGTPCTLDVVFLDTDWRTLRVVHRLPPRRWVAGPRGTRLSLLLAEGRCEVAGLSAGMALMQDATAARAVQPFATTVLRRAGAETRTTHRGHPGEPCGISASESGRDSPPNKNSAMRSRG